VALAGSLLEGFSRGCHVPAFGKELADGALLSAFLHTQFVVQKMVGKCTGAVVTGIDAVVDAIDANAIAVAIGTNQAHFQIWL
jgi:hypothetical protein